MKRITIWIVLVMILCTGCASGETVSGIRELFMPPAVTATPAPNAFRFRNGIRWGMSEEDVKALENVPMQERATQTWSIMLTDGKVTVSCFTADLIFMFRNNHLMMISYEFLKEAQRNFIYLSEALSTVYGIKTEVEPQKIKVLMDAIDPNHYQTELITQACGWTAADGTTVFLYYYSPEDFAITYVCPDIYMTNGL